MIKKVIILNGPAESGKGTFVKLIKEKTQLEVFEESSITFAKDIMKEYLFWDGKTKDRKTRNCLAAIKQLSIEYGNIPHTLFKDRVKELDESPGGDCVLFTDIREPEEISKAVKYCTEKNIPIMTVRILNSKAEKLAEELKLSKTGDNSYHKYVYDMYIDNNGPLEDLEKEANFFCRKFLS